MKTIRVDSRYSRHERVGVSECRRVGVSAASITIKNNSLDLIVLKKTHPFSSVLSVVPKKFSAISAALRETWVVNGERLRLFDYDYAYCPRFVK